MCKLIGETRECDTSSTELRRKEEGSEEDKGEMSESVNLNVRKKRHIMWQQSQAGPNPFLMYTIQIPQSIIWSTFSSLFTIHQYFHILNYKIFIIPEVVYLIIELLSVVQSKRSHVGVVFLVVASSFNRFQHQDYQCIRVAMSHLHIM